MSEDYKDGGRFSPSASHHEMTTPVTPHPRRLSLLIITVVFALLCMVQWGEVVRAGLGLDSDYRILTLLKLVSGACAYAAAVGTFRRRPWAWVASLLYGVVTAVLILAVGPVAGLDAEERKGLIWGATSMLLIGAGLALYLRNVLRPPR